LVKNAEPTPQAITRFAPGLIGPIFTDDLDELADNMRASNEVTLRQHYGLWYDRRRMDHERMRRPDADAWPPFFEQPFARTGQGSAWDGLSRYDLTKYNPWYFGRLHEFAALARQKGLVLVNEMYFQHNLLEAGAHWVDSPWRPTNNINGTQFTEPVPFTGDTMKMAAEFYDLSNPLHRSLHRAYIRQCLANLADEPNVIHTLSAENSGPLHFMQFWLDVVGEWERETGKHPLIALSACKDVQDAILADPPRAALIDAIDFTYWWRTEKGAEFAPKGGTDLAPRQHERLWKNGRPSAASIARMAREYREKFPDKAIITGLDQVGGLTPVEARARGDETGDASGERVSREAWAWPFVAAGGSFAKLPPTTDAKLLAAIARMSPQGKAEPHAWTLGERDVGYFVVALGGGILLDLSGETGVFRVHRIDPASGRMEEVSNETVNGGGAVSLAAASSGRLTVVWLTR
jgi:hypothetical protein